MSIALHSQRIGRQPPRRFVHAQRARKLRRAGVHVTFHHTSPTGRAVYVWVLCYDVTFVDHAPSWGAEPYTIERMQADFIALRDTGAWVALS